MNTLHSGANVLRRAEGELRALIAQAADRAEYDSLIVLADWAKQLGALLQLSPKLESHGPSLGITDESLPNPTSPAKRGSARASKNLNGTPGKPTTRRRKIRTRTQDRKKTANGAYPQFLREGDELVKVGWSKREKAPYEHKAPKRVVLLLAEAIQRKGQNAKRFKMEQVLSLHDPNNDSDVPSYQVYLSLAWLRTTGIVLQHGRQGYSLPTPGDMAESIESRWFELASR